MLLKSITTFLVSLALVTAAAAQSKPSKAEISNFRLSMTNLRSMITAYVSTVNLVAADPALAGKLKAEQENADEAKETNSFMVATRHLAAADPRIKAAFVSAGITPEQAGMTMECLMGVALADGMLGGKDKEIKAEPVVTENLAFYRQHKTEITALLQQFQSAAAKANSVIEKRDGRSESEQ